VVQNEGIVTWLMLGDEMKQVRIRPEVAFVIGDGKSADMLTLRQGGHRANAARISRACHTPQNECSDVLCECEFVELLPPLTDTNRSNSLVMLGRTKKKRHNTELVLDSALEDNNLKSNIEDLSTIAPLDHIHLADVLPITPGGLTPDQKKEHLETVLTQARDRLKRCGFHPVRNAFHARCIRFGLDPRNVWGANPTDLMHAYQSGIMMYLTKMILIRVGQSSHPPHFSAPCSARECLPQNKLSSAKQGTYKYNLRGVYLAGS
jgi:hypothetical protein